MLTHLPLKAVDIERLLVKLAGFQDGRGKNRDSIEIYFSLYQKD